MANAELPAKSRRNAGRFLKGNAGRPKGTPNKATERVRATINLALEETSGDVVQWLRRLGDSDPKGALQVYAALSEFVLPKLSRVEAKNEGTANVRHVITFKR